MTNYVVFEGQADLNAFITMAKIALVKIDAEIKKRNDQCAEIDNQLEEFRALPWYKKMFKSEPAHYTFDMTYGRQHLKKFRNEIQTLVESAMHATAIHIKDQDMDTIMRWTK